MPYLILDPGADYAATMVEFLGQRGLTAVAIFTDEGRMAGYHHMFSHRLGAFVVDEYLMPEWPDTEALAAAIRQDYPGAIEGVIPWDERTILMGAKLGAAVGVRWNPPEVIERFRDKYVMKDHLRRHSAVRLNASQVVQTEEQAFEFARTLGRWPVVVKPSAGAGSKGVMFAESDDELIRACIEVFSVGDGEVLLEEYVGGQEYVVNGIVDAEQTMLVTDVWAYDKRPGNGVPNLYYQTVKVSTFDPEFWPLAEYAAEVIGAMGLRRAPVHMELKVDERGPCLIEVGARFAGGNQPTLASELHRRSLFELAACHYMAELPLRIEDVSYEAYDSRHARIISGVQSIPLEHISAVMGVDRVEALPSFQMFGSLYPPGMPLPVTIDLYTRSYEVYLLHEDPDQVAYDAEVIRQVLHYV